MKIVAGQYLRCLLQFLLEGTKTDRMLWLKWLDLVMNVSRRVETRNIMLGEIMHDPSDEGVPQVDGTLGG